MAATWSACLRRIIADAGLTVEDFMRYSGDEVRLTPSWWGVIGV